MSNDTATDVTERRSGITQWIAVAAVLATGGLLALGATLVGDTGDVGDPGAYVRTFYAENDAEGLLDALAEGTVPPEQREQAVRDLTALLRDDVEVADTETFTVAGVAVTRVDMSDGLTWCVDPAGTLFFRCRVGTAEVSVDSEDFRSTVAQVDVYVDRAELVVGLSPIADSLTLEQAPRLEGADGASSLQLQRSAIAATGLGGGMQNVTFDEPVDLVPVEALLLAYGGDLEALAGASFTLAWENASATLEVGPVDWLF